MQTCKSVFVDIKAEEEFHAEKGKVTEWTAHAQDNPPRVSDNSLQ